MEEELTFEGYNLEKWGEFSAGLSGFEIAQRQSPNVAARTDIGNECQHPLEPQNTHWPIPIPTGRSLRGQPSPELDQIMPPWVRKGRMWLG